MKTATIELTRHNVTPSQFLAHVRGMLVKKGIREYASDLDLRYFAAGNDLNFKYENDPEKPCKAETSISKPYEMQTYVKNWNGTVYNEICEFQFDGEQKGTGYYFLRNDIEETTETTNTEKEGEKKMKNTNKAATKNAENKGYDLSKLAEAYHMTLEANGTDVPFHSPRGNSKLGSIPAFNLLPVVTCSAEACRTCGKGGCYAVKNCLCRGYDIDKNNTLRAWTHNTILALHDVHRLEIELERYFSAVTSPRYFRIHSSGDFKTVEYANMWYRIAQRHPETQFLAFTKQWDVIREVPFYTLPNFSLVLSGWDGIIIPEDLQKLYPVALCVEEIPENVPDNCFVCPGDCEHCAMCWRLAKFGLYVIFKKH